MKGLSPRMTAQIAAAGVLLALAVVYRFPPEAYGFYPSCPFLTWLHVECPGCGSTRALHALLHGDWAEAAARNALFPAWFLAAAAWGAAQYVVATWRNRFLRLQAPEPMYWSAAAAAMVFAVVRNLV